MISQFNRLAKDYDLWYEKEKRTFQAEVKAFQPMLSFMPKPWLELGVGSGRFAQALGITWGMDPAKDLLRISRRRGIQVAAGRGEFLPLLPQSVGSIFVILTLCFVEFPKQVFQECHRALIREGKMAVGFIPRPSPWGLYYLEKKKQGHPLYQFARFYSVGQVEEMVMAAGFSIQGIISTLFQKPGDVRKKENPMEGYRSQAGFLVLMGERRD